MRKKFINIIGIALFLASIVSCNTAEQDPSPVVAPDSSYPVIEAVTLENTGTLTEGDTIIYTISFNKAIDRSITFSYVIDTNLTTAEEHVEFDIMPATMEPWETETELMIVTYSDIDVESDEMIVFDLNVTSLAEKYLLHPDNVLPTVTTTLANYTDDNLVLEFYWAVDIDLGFGVYSTSNNTDFDIFYSDAAGYDSMDPWATWNNTSYAATGNHPEVITITPGLLPDGDYVFWFDFWSNAFYGYGIETPIPVSCKVYKAGIFSETVIQDPSSIVNANMPGYAETEDETNGTIVQLNVSGSTFTISDYSGTEVVSGKTTSERTPRPAYIKK